MMDDETAKRVLAVATECGAYVGWRESMKLTANRRQDAKDLIKLAHDSKRRYGNRASRATNEILRAAGESACDEVANKQQPEFYQRLAFDQISDMSRRISELEEVMRRHLTGELADVLRRREA